LDKNTPVEHRYLLHHHQLTDYQRIEKLHPVDSLGNRKPSHLLSQMMDLCPYSKQQSKFFTFLFSDCIPSWLRICKERTTTRL
jgi:hypothetical protein